jgi:putative transposase
LSPDHRRWVRPSYPFFLPVSVLSRIFRGKFCAGLKRLHRRGQLRCAGPASALADPKQFRQLLRRVHRQGWRVYAKPAFGGPRKVLRYLGRYTHRIAISNHRLVAFDGEHVTFRWKDYAHGGKQRKMTLLATEFLRRFFLHVLPKGFVRIRYFGFLANRFRAHCLPLCQQLLASDRRPPSTVFETTAIWHCPNCGTAMILIQRLTAVELSRCSYFDSS